MASATPGRIPVWAVPLSLAATDGIDVSLFSCGYLDVSVPRVSSNSPIHSASSNTLLQVLCFHIQKSPDQCLFASFPELIAGCRVFLRLSMPRHPPYTLGKLDPLDRGSTHATSISSFTRRSPSRDSTSFSRSLLRQQVLERCPPKTKRPEIHNPVSLRQKSHEPRIKTAGIAKVTLIRTSYLVVKELRFCNSSIA